MYKGAAAKSHSRLPSKPASQKTGLISSPFQKPAPGVPGGSGAAQKIVLNYDKADITKVTNQIFGDYLKLNYVIDPSLQGRISLYLEGQFTKTQLLHLVTKAYEASNIAVVANNGIYYIQPVQRSASSGLPLAGSFVLQKGKAGVSPVIVIYRLRYLDAKQALSTIRPFLTPGRPVTVDSMTNSLIFAEDPDNARSILEVLKTLDINVFREVGMEIVPLRALTPDEAVKSMEALTNQLDIFKQSAVKSHVAFLPLEQFGGVLILAQNPEVLHMAKRWLTALDVQGHEAGEQVYVYFVKNGLAKDIASILDQVFALKGQAPAKRPEQQIVQATTQQQAPGQKKAETQITGGVAFNTQLSGQVSIIPDEVNNAIVIRSNAVDHAMIQKVIDALDIAPRAVLIEVTLAEITLNKSMQFGVQWYVQSHRKQFQAALSNQKSGTSIDFSSIDLQTANATGLTMFWQDIGGSGITALLSMLAEQTSVRVLSTPTLLASDNKEASITVGGSEPISTGSGITTGDVQVNNIQYEQTGIILTVTPHITASGQVRMDIDQTTRTPQTNSFSKIDSPSFQERKIKTTVIAGNGDTVIIGGIIQNERDHGKSGIPFLKDIPLISPLFSSTNDTYSRDELIIAITPHVILNHRNTAATQEFINRLKSLKSRIEGKLY